MAFPFFTGFYSKDFLLTLLLVPTSLTATAAYILTLAAALFTTLYSIRVFMISFLSSPSYTPILNRFIADGSSLLSFPLLFLSVFAVGFGYLSQFLFLDFGTDSYLNSIFIHPAHFHLLDGTLSSFSWLKFLPLLLLTFFIKLIPRSPFSSSLKGLTSLPLNPSPVSPASPVHKVYFISTFHFYDVFVYYMIATYTLLSLYTYRYFDKGVLELAGPYGISRFTHFLGFFLE